MDLWLRLTCTRPDRGCEVQPLLLSGPRHRRDRRRGRTRSRRLGRVELAQTRRLGGLERRRVGAITTRGGGHQECCGAGQGAFHTADHSGAEGSRAGSRRTPQGARHTSPRTAAAEPAVQLPTHQTCGGSPAAKWQPGRDNESWPSCATHPRPGQPAPRRRHREASLRAVFTPIRPQLGSCMAAMERRSTCPTGAPSPGSADGAIRSRCVRADLRAQRRLLRVVPTYRRPSDRGSWRPAQTRTVARRLTVEFWG